MQQPVDFEDSNFLNHVFRLEKAIYGLNQEPKAWFQRFSETLLHLGFSSSHANSSLFVRWHKGEIVILLVYVNDILITRNNIMIMQTIISQWSTQFALKDMGSLQFFFGI